jgi:methionine-rich copper-binding protein CopC
MIRSASLAPWLAAALMGLPLLAATPALAHAALLSEVPASGAGMAVAPTELRLSFSEALELSFTKVVLTAADGRAIATGALSLAPGDDKTLVVPLTAPLSAGAATVEWTVVATDGHKSKGSYILTIAN